MVQLQVLTVAMPRGNESREHMLWIVQPELGNPKTEVARHADQQDFQQRLQVRGFEQHALHLPRLLQ